MSFVVFDRCRCWRTAWPALIIISLWLFVFWPLLTGQYVAGFRDSVYLYYPLFKFIDLEWAAGGIPLYNLYDGSGQPLLADGSSSIFYPGKLLFFCRFLSFPARYGGYLSLHVLLAAANAYFLARLLRCNRLGGTVAAISYAFGGSVLFQVNNVIYLVGAAWLPLALACVWMMFRRPDWKWPLAGGAVCALMLLGGDPQMVYNVGLIAAATLVVTSFSPFLVCDWGKRFRNRFSWVAGKAARLLLLVAVTATLSAVQLLPSYEIVNSSKRAQSRDGPVNLYAAFSEKPGSATMAEALLGNPPAGSHRSHIYQFSMPPWMLTELLWPNISGQPFPINLRWSSGLPGADRVWVPSIYMGALTVLLALGSFRLWGSAARDVWLSRLGLWFGLAAFGWYGVAWLLGELGFVWTFGGVDPVSNEPKSWQLGPQVGGLYWLMVVALPKYFWFRYPAKLFLIAVLAISILAGRTLSKRRPLRRIAPMIFSLLLLSLLGCCLANTLPRWIEPFQDPIFGPLQMGALPNVILHSMWQVLGVLVLGLVALKGMEKGGVRRPTWGGLFLGILAVDLVMANAWMLALVPAAVFETPVQSKYQTEASWEQSSGSLTFKMRPIPANPYQGSGFAMAGSENRLAENVIWQRETLFPKHHLPLRIVHPNSFASIESSGSRTGILGWIEDCRQSLGDFEEMEVGSGSFSFSFTIPPGDMSRKGAAVDTAAPLIPWGPEKEGWQIGLIHQADSQPISQPIGHSRTRLIDGHPYLEVPPGNWRIEGHYWPVSFVRGAVVSLVAWCSWLTCIVLLAVLKSKAD